MYVRALFIMVGRYFPEDRVLCYTQVVFDMVCNCPLILDRNQPREPVQRHDNQRLETDAQQPGRLQRHGECASPYLGYSQQVLRSQALRQMVEAATDEFQSH